VGSQVGQLVGGGQEGKLVVGRVVGMCKLVGMGEDTVDEASARCGIL
jgi:hypothetical protein